MRGHPFSAPSRRTLEELGQAYGFVLYTHTSIITVNGVLHPYDRARDRVLAYLNGIKQRVIDSQYQQSLNVIVSLRSGDKLQLLVEYLGCMDDY